MNISLLLLLMDEFVCELYVVGWRPAFKFYSMWLSLVGAVLCIFVMFIMSWPTALVTMAVIAVLFFYVHYRKPGSITITTSYTLMLFNTT